ncbi:MAG TPA: TolC family protein [Polyangia bacterium]|nr:TolC family protein [Polyangia bacterium]
MRALRTLAPLALLLTSAVARAQMAQASDDARPQLKVTWAEALDRAFKNNATILVATQEIERADALVRQARGAWLPTLAGNGSLTRLNSARNFGGMQITPQNSWNANLTLNVPLISPLAWGNDAHAADGRDVAKASAADVRRELAVSVGRTYLTVLLQHREVEVAIRARDTAAAHYDYAHTRLTTGLGNGVDDARAEQELRTNEAQVKNAETALVRAQSALAILLSAEDLVDVADEVALDAAPTTDSALADARARRPDVRALQARRTATEHLRRDDWLYYAPSLLGQAEAFEETASPLQPGSGWQASLILAVPIFDGGVRYGVQRERRAEDEEARVQLEGLLRQVSVEVRSAFTIVRNADESLRSSRAAVTAALMAASLADRSYRAGASTNIEVIDAERQARDAESQAALAEDAARQARLDLLVATGAFP